MAGDAPAEPRHETHDPREVPRRETVRMYSGGQWHDAALVVREDLRPGDVVVKFGDRDVSDSRALTRMVGEAQVGEEVAIEVVRESRRILIAATILRLEEAESGPPIVDGERERRGAAARWRAARRAYLRRCAV